MSYMCVHTKSPHPKTRPLKEGHDCSTGQPKPTFGPPKTTIKRGNECSTGSKCIYLFDVFIFSYHYFLCSFNMAILCAFSSFLFFTLWISHFPEHLFAIMKDSFLYFRNGCYCSKLSIRISLGQLTISREIRYHQNIII